MQAGFPGAQRLLQSLHLHVVGNQERVGKTVAQPPDSRRRQGDRTVLVPLPDDGVADQHRIAEHLRRQRVEQFFLFGVERIRNVHEFLMRIHDSAADTGKMLQAQAEPCVAGDLAGQQGVGCDFGNVGGVGTLDLADTGIVGVVVDVDHRGEIIVDAELSHLGKTVGKYLALFLDRQTVEIPGARQRLEPGALLEPPHQAAFLVDEYHRTGRQARDLLAQAAQLLRRFDVVVVFLRLTRIVEQDHATEAVTIREFPQPGRDRRAEEAENEEFADLHSCAFANSHAFPVDSSMLKADG